MSKLEIKDLSYVYGAGTPFEIKALDSVNATFEDGLITGLIGHTGCGKSTLVQMLNGLLKPDSGQVLLDGKDIWENPKEISRIRYRVGLVMQYPEYQLFEETVRADIAYGPRNMGLSEEQIEQAVLEAAASVGIDEATLDRSPFDLSGGQKRRVAMAGVIAMRPDILVLDEPAAGLDPRGRREVLGGLLKYSRDNNRTVVLVSHSMEDMAAYCDRLIVMNGGKVEKSGTPSEIFEDPALLEACGLDIPQITHTVSLLREKGFDIPRGIYTVEAAADALESFLQK